MSDSAYALLPLDSGASEVFPILQLGDPVGLILSRVSLNNTGSPFRPDLSALSAVSPSLCLAIAREAESFDCSGTDSTARLAWALERHLGLRAGATGAQDLLFSGLRDPGEAAESDTGPIFVSDLALIDAIHPSLALSIDLLAEPQPAMVRLARLVAARAARGLSAPRHSIHLEAPSGPLLSSELHTVISLLGRETAFLEWYMPTEATGESTESAPSAEVRGLAESLLSHCPNLRTLAAGSRGAFLSLQASSHPGQAAFRPWLAALTHLTSLQLTDAPAGDSAADRLLSLSLLTGLKDLSFFSLTPAAIPSIAQALRSLSCLTSLRICEAVSRLVPSLDSCRASLKKLNLVVSCSDAQFNIGATADALKNHSNLDTLSIVTFRVAQYDGISRLAQLPALASLSLGPGPYSAGPGSEPFRIEHTLELTPLTALTSLCLDNAGGRPSLATQAAMLLSSAPRAPLWSPPAPPPPPPLNNPGSAAFGNLTLNDAPTPMSGNEALQSSRAPAPVPFFFFPSLRSLTLSNLEYSPSVFPLFSRLAPLTNLVISQQDVSPDRLFTLDRLSALKPLSPYLKRLSISGALPLLAPEGLGVRGGSTGEGPAPGAAVVGAGQLSTEGAAGFGDAGGPDGPGGQSGGAGGTASESSEPGVYVGGAASIGDIRAALRCQGFLRLRELDVR